MSNKTMKDSELTLIPVGEICFFDVECYRNLFYIAFKFPYNGKVVRFEESPRCKINKDKLNWILWRFTIVGFNSNNYDILQIERFLNEANCDELKESNDFIIKGRGNQWDFKKEYGIEVQPYNHIDLIEVAPLQGSLKLYGGRLHCKTIQDLPIHEDTILNEKQADIIIDYCDNDLDVTELIFNKLTAEIKLRCEMSEKYGVDLKSKSDAQIAEAVIKSELQKVLGYWPKKPKNIKREPLQYTTPNFVSFESPQLRNLLEIIEGSVFDLDGRGSPVMPKGLEKLKVQIGNSVYKPGMGGLHSQEKQTSHKATDEIILADNDVASFYPRIILNQRLYPEHLGEAFLEVYEKIVDTRIHAKGEAAKAKKKGDLQSAKHFKTIADSLKITINGSFGKLGNKYSTLYSPQLMLQVTITGQLVLLMLIEMLENGGIEVVSGNTDGVVLKYHKSRHEEVRNIINKWEKRTNFETEETRYTAVYSRDVNNYIAIKDGEGYDTGFLDDKLNCKAKGTYCERGSTLNSILSKNPEMLVCNDAVLQFLKNRIPVESTIRNCTDIRRFITVRNVKGGGEKNGIYLGKVVRFYYPKNERGFISYVGSGNKVAKTDGAKPLMQLPDVLPDDIDYDYYINEAIEMLKDCEGVPVPKQQNLF